MAARAPGRRRLTHFPPGARNHSPNLLPVPYAD